MFWPSIHRRSACPSSRLDIGDPAMLLMLSRVKDRGTRRRLRDCPSKGRWDEAEKIEVQVIETFAEKLVMQVMEAFQTKLGSDHPSTLASIASLALMDRNLSR